MKNTILRLLALHRSAVGDVILWNALRALPFDGNDSERYDAFQDTLKDLRHEGLIRTLDNFDGAFERHELIVPVSALPAEVHVG